MNEAVRVIHDRLVEDDTLRERTNLHANVVTDLLYKCLPSTNFSYKGRFYEQKEGTVMGSPVSAVVALHCGQSPTDGD